MDLAAKGADALKSGDFALAVKQYTLAIHAHPEAVDYYIKRSTAYTRLSPSNPILALGDAEVAVVLAHKRGKRELIAQAQLRRGIALFTADRWGDAGQCFEWTKSLMPKEKSLPIWEAKVQSRMAVLKDGDDKGEIRVKEIPDLDIQLVKDAASRAAKEVTAQASKQTLGDQSNPTGVQQKLEGAQTPAHQIRHEWYQSTDAVTVTLMAKGIPKDKATVEIRSDSINISFPLPTGSHYDFSLEPLFADVDVPNSSCKIMSTKVEFNLKKAVPGQKWHDLERTGPVSAQGLGSKDDANDSIKQAQAPVGPVYPTSSKTGPKNWDKVVNDLTKKPKNPKKTKKTKEDADEDEENTGDELYDDDADESGDPASHFFKQLFKGADPDTQRAMMKSYTESNGTALSTNWAEVGKGKVETSPPDGMEARKWDQ